MLILLFLLLNSHTIQDSYHLQEDIYVLENPECGCDQFYFIDSDSCDMDSDFNIHYIEDNTKIITTTHPIWI